jgi:hypothetical protein
MTVLSEFSLVPELSGVFKESLLEFSVPENQVDNQVKEIYVK